MNTANIALIWYQFFFVFGKQRLLVSICLHRGIAEQTNVMSADIARLNPETKGSKEFGYKTKTFVLCYREALEVAGDLVRWSKIANRRSCVLIDFMFLTFYARPGKVCNIFWHGWPNETFRNKFPCGVPPWKR